MRACGWAVVRCARLPAGELEAFGADAQDDAILRERLAAWASRPAVRDALHVSSPQLDRTVQLWLEEGAPPAPALESTLSRYLLRMAGRATPFGLHAGWATAKVADSGPFALSGEEAPCSRLNMERLFVAADELLSDPELRPELAVRTSPWLRRSHDRLLHVATRTERGTRRHDLVATRPTEPLEATLERARGGATLQSLTEDLVGSGFAADAAAAWLDDLVATGLLVPDLALTVHGSDPAQRLQERLAVLPAGIAASEVLAKARAALAAADAARPGERAARHGATAALLAELPGQASGRPVAQVDLRFDAPGLTLPCAVVAEIARGVEILRRVGPQPAPAELETFVARFKERYGTEDVSFLEAIDPEAGIGFPDRAPPPGPEVQWGPLQDLLARAAASGAREVELSDADVARLPEPAHPLPGSFAALALLGAQDAQALGSGDFEVHVRSASGPTAARLVGRFAHADDTLGRHVRELLAAEEAREPDAIHAEVVHLPAATHGNAIARARMFTHEIVLSAGSEASPEHRIDAADLLLSLDNGALTLRSRSRARRVIPHVTSAHNWLAPGLPAYRLLGMLSQQGVTGSLAFGWGPLGTLPHLPRVRSGRVILSLERWTAGPRELSEAYDDGPGAVSAWRQRRGMPRWVALESGEGLLPLDLDNPLGHEALRKCVRARDTAVLYESWPRWDRLPLTSPAGALVSEVVVPFTSEVPAALGERRRSARRVTRRFPPGSEWGYLKVYCGEATADRVVVERVAPVVAGRRWHFARLADPDPHLRVRLHGDRGELAELGRRLVADGVCRRVVLDTYEREVERYGGPDAIELAEQIFSADSDAVVALLAALPGDDASARDRWQAGVLGVATLLRDLELEGPDQRAVVALQREVLASEQGKDRRWLADGLRPVQKGLGSQLDAALAGSAKTPLLDALELRRAAVAPVVAKLVAADAAGHLTRARGDIAASLVHMHINRLARSRPRETELRAVDAVDRLLGSRAARGRHAAAEVR